jgi:hypothetical protein
MAQSSKTISASRSHQSNISITGGASFVSSGGTNTITSTSVSMATLQARDIISISGTVYNNSTLTVKSVAANGLSITVEETLTTESRDGSTATVIDHVGFVTEKQKGDGYYSQTDGVHTVAYHVGSSLNTTAVLKMQGSLATTPTEDDWFDITGTTINSSNLDGSTLAFSANFTGNFVWVRAKITGMTAGNISKILYNH